MNEFAFNKVIKKLILPKFPWITDYEVVVDGDDSINDYPDKSVHYVVNYFIDQNIYDLIDTAEGYEKISDVKEFTKTLFMAIGFDKNKKLLGVDFYSESHK